MMSYLRFADTIYDSKNLSIISLSHFSPITPSSITRYNASDFHYIIQSALTPNLSTTDPKDVIQVDSLSVILGWGLRLYDELFTQDNQTAHSYLHNLVLIPLGFCLPAWELANATAEAFATGVDLVTTNSNNENGYYPLPDQLATKASSALAVPRLKAEPWTVWAFVALSGVLLLYAVAIFVWIVVWPGELLETTAFAEVDAARRLVSGEPVGQMVLRNRHGVEERLGLVLQGIGGREGDSLAVVTALSGARLFLNNLREGEESSNFAVP
jgi:hypothetical protein